MTVAVVATAFGATVLCGCPDDEPGSVVIGLTSDYQAGSDLAELGVEMAVDGKVIAKEDRRLGAPDTEFPTELAFEGLADGATVSATMRGFDPEGVLRVVRHLETKAVAGTDRLTRVHLEQLCMLTSEEEVMEGAPESAPTCNEVTETCISGTCKPAFVDPSQHRPYTPDWASASGDACKPGGGAPTVIVGTGQADFFATDDYALAEVEAGPQGGHHIWVAARIKNLRQSGSITSVGGEIPALGLSITPLKVIFTMDTDEGGFCKLYGLRFQLDIDGDEIETMLGQEVKVVVTITDSDGAVGTDELWLTLSDYII